MWCIYDRTVVATVHTDYQVWVHWAGGAMSKEVSDIVPNLSTIRGKPSCDWWHQWAQPKSSLA